MWWKELGARDENEVTMTQEDLEKAADSILRTHRKLLILAMERLGRALVLCEGLETFQDCTKAAQEALTLLSNALTSYRPTLISSEKHSVESRELLDTLLTKVLPKQAIANKSTDDE